MTSLTRSIPSCDPRAAVTTRQEHGGALGGVVTDPLPRNGQLSLGSRLSDAYDDEGKRILRRLHSALTSGGQSINDAAEALGMDGALLTRVLSGNGANIPPRLLAYALWHDRTHDLARHLADLAGGEWKPKPLPDASFWLPRVREDLERRGLWSLVADAVGYRDLQKEP
jgi:hypothetical protein